MIRALREKGLLEELPSFCWVCGTSFYTEEATFCVTCRTFYCPGGHCFCSLTAEAQFAIDQELRTLGADPPGRRKRRR